MWVIFYCFCSQFPQIASKNTCSKFIILRCVIVAPVELHPPVFLAPVWHFIREASSWFLFFCPYLKHRLSEWPCIMNRTRTCVYVRKELSELRNENGFPSPDPSMIDSSRPECRMLDLTITGHVLNGSSELMFALVLFLRERWRLRNNSMMPNSSPPKRKRSSKWIRWPWSWSWSGPRHSGKSTCFNVTWVGVLGNFPSEIFTNTMSSSKYGDKLAH